MTHWLYLLTAKEMFPEPRAEVSALATLYDEGHDAYLLLANGECPPGKTAQQGDAFKLCVRDNRLLYKCGLAVAGGKAQKHAQTPKSVHELYGELKNRWFVPLQSVETVPEQAITEMTPEQQRTFANGQAFVRILSRNWMRSSTRAADKGVQLAGRPECDTLFVKARLPKSGLKFLAIGLDPTAGEWESSMTGGRKAMPSAALSFRDGEIRPLDPCVKMHLNNADFLSRVNDLEADIACIDGPCDTNGPTIKDGWIGWDAGPPNSFRDGERQLACEGVSLFWTTAGTVERFEGASRWIARSLRLFKQIEIKAIETHPHGVFSFLWRWSGNKCKLPRKSTGEGANVRFKILQSFIPSLSPGCCQNDNQHWDHDRIDAICAALVAVLHKLELTRSFGTPDKGGQIWMPDIDKLFAIPTG